MMTTTKSARDLATLPSSSISTSLDNEAITKALLPRTLSFPSSQQRRRRISSDGSLSSLPDRQPSLRRDVERAASETYLVTRLSFKLLRYLGYSPTSLALCLQF
ncbi:hypothetical protein ACLOJK_032432 [Asimina triloba]